MILLAIQSQSQAEPPENSSKPRCAFGLSQKHQSRSLGTSLSVLQEKLRGKFAAPFIPKVFGIDLQMVSLMNRDACPKNFPLVL